MRAMIRLELTLDVDTDAGMEVFARVLKESPGARLFLNCAIAHAVEETARAFGDFPMVATVNTATARAYVAAGIRGQTAKKPRRRVEITQR